jgi:hypothetical protein
MMSKGSQQHMSNSNESGMVVDPLHKPEGMMGRESFFLAQNNNNGHPNNQTNMMKIRKEN